MDEQQTPGFMIRRTIRKVEEDVPDAHVYGCNCPECSAKKAETFSAGLCIGVLVVMLFALVACLALMAR